MELDQTVHKLPDLSIGYLAGLIDGEGSFHIRDERRVDIRVDSTDLDILERAFTYSGGLGYISGPFQRRNSDRKKIWTWTIGKAEDVIFIIESIMPHMSLRRQEKMIQCLEITESIVNRVKVCAGCGIEIRNFGNNRKWCSRSCSRKVRPACT